MANQLYDMYGIRLRQVVSNHLKLKVTNSDTKCRIYCFHLLTTEFVRAISAVCVLLFPSRVILISM